MLVHKKIMSDRYYCKKSFRKTLRKVHFCITIVAHKSMKDSYVLKAAAYVTKLSSFLCALLLMTSFLLRPRIHISRASTARELHDKYIIFSRFKHDC